MSLENFTNTILAIKALEKKHSEVFDEYNKLLELKGQQEVELKQEAKEKGDQDNGLVKVSVIRKFKKWYEFNHFTKDAQKVLEDAGAIKYKEPEIDKDKLNELADGNLISREEIKNAYCEEEMSPAITIKILI